MFLVFLLMVVAFGDEFPAVIDLGSLGSLGFVVNGDAESDQSGESVSPPILTETA